MPKKLSSTKVLVTGAGGFIGSHLCELLMREGADVRAFLHYNSRGDWGMLAHASPAMLRNVEIHSGDLRDPEAVRKAVRGCSLVFHLGALIGIPYSYVNPLDVVCTNVLGSAHVLQAALEFGVERMVQTSTSEVYGTAQYVPMDESHPLVPQSPYAATKVAGDKLAESYHKSFGLPVTVLRPFNTYGPRQSPRAVIPTVILQALKGSRIRLGNTGPRRDFTFVTDTARGFMAAALSPAAVGQTVQIGTCREISVSDLVNAVGAILGKRLSIERDERRDRPQASEVERLYASNRRAAELLQWRPRVTLEQGLAKTIHWFQAQRGQFRADLYHV
jgi:NAD dependent epimerase/dehydratase